MNLSFEKNLALPERTPKFKLGMVVKDVITGYEGMVVARTHRLNGCIRYGVQSRELEERKPVDIQYLDEEQLFEVKQEAATEMQPSNTGGDREAPKRSIDDKR